MKGREGDYPTRVKTRADITKLVKTRADITAKFDLAVQNSRSIQGHHLYKL